MRTSSTQNTVSKLKLVWMIFVSIYYHQFILKTNRGLFCKNKSNQAASSSKEDYFTCRSSLQAISNQVCLCFQIEFYLSLCRLHERQLFSNKDFKKSLRKYQICTTVKILIVGQFKWKKRATCSQGAFPQIPKLFSLKFILLLMPQWRFALNVDVIMKFVSYGMMYCMTLEFLNRHLINLTLGWLILFMLHSHVLIGISTWNSSYEEITLRMG